jgi:hypothetical protein
MDSAPPQCSSDQFGRWRLLATLTAVPAFDAVAGYATFPVVWWLGNHGSFRPISAQQPALDFGVLAGLLGFLVMITAGLPAAFQLIRRGRTSIRHFALAGVVLGNLPFAAYLCVVIVFTLIHLFAGTLAEHLSSPVKLLAGAVRAVLIGSVFGAASGVMFWLIAMRGDESRSARAFVASPMTLDGRN